MPTRSPLFSGAIGQTIAAPDCPASNYLFGAVPVDYEAVWAFCRFDQEEVFAGRFGVARGRFHAADYGAPTVPDDGPRLRIHLELLTARGVIQWITSREYGPGEFRSGNDRLDYAVVSRGRDVLRIADWPVMSWRIKAADDSAEIDLRARMQTFTVLPDSLLPHNLFAMSMATGTIEGSCRIDDRTTELTGVILCDHPRIRVCPQDAPAFGYYMYAPLRLSDGGRWVSYFTRDQRGRRVPDYSFALWIRPDGSPHWLASTELSELKFDEDRQPTSWRQRWENDTVRVTAEYHVNRQDIIRVWGDPGVTASRANNPLLPLDIGARLSVSEPGKTSTLTGDGVGEFVIHPLLAERIVAEHSGAQSP